MTEANLKVGAVRRPPCTVEIVHHNFDDNDAVLLDIAVVLPQTFRRRVDMEGDAAEALGEFFAHAVEIRSVASASDDREKNFDKERHGTLQQWTYALNIFEANLFLRHRNFEAPLPVIGGQRDTHEGDQI
ncbi:hypothetical protein G9X66_20580 [Rhizobium indigoferae]|nr:hypothetical protein [Rhizobium indigoferae]